MNPEQFQTALAEKGIELSDTQLKQFHDYFEMLVEWNEKMNLTAITDEKEVYLKHFYDSISAAFYVDFTKFDTICDVGAGAGFPSLPIKICFPHLKVSIVDSLKKRMTFLDALAEKLGLTDVHFYHDRAETFGQNKAHREKIRPCNRTCRSKNERIIRALHATCQKRRFVLSNESSPSRTRAANCRKSHQTIRRKSRGTLLFLPTSRRKRAQYLRHHENKRNPQQISTQTRNTQQITNRIN